MPLYNSLFILMLALTTITTFAARKSAESVLLSNVKTLTLRKDLKTSHNRVSAVPQLACVGGTAKGFYEIDILRCKNAGSSYGDEDIQWTCSASLPSEFKLGSTDVICEGFSSSEDSYVLKGSCGVEYRLMLTELGEEKYGKKGKDTWEGYRDSQAGNHAALGFWVLFFAVVGWMVYAAFVRDDGVRRPRGINNLGFGGGGGGGDNDDPPPPYDYHPPPPKSKASSSSSRAPRAAPAQAQQGWRPGFWSGALGGAAAGYMAGNRGQNQQPRDQTTWGSPQANVGGNGEGSSRWGGSGSTRSCGSSNSSSNSSYGTSRHESSGFGGTNRR